MKVYVVIEKNWSGGDYEESHCSASVAGVYMEKADAEAYVKTQFQNSWREFEINLHEVKGA